MYKVSEFAELTGLSKDTLRYYAEVELLEPAFIDPKNQYRYYDDGSYFIALLLGKLRRFGCGVQEMKSIMADQSFANLEKLLMEKREAMNAQIQHLMTMRDELDEFLKDGKEDNND